MAPGMVSMCRYFGSVRAAIEFFRQGNPVDLIFSDIQLGILSFEIFRRVPVTAPIFVRSGE